MIIEDKNKSEFVSKEAEERAIQEYGHPVKDLIRILSDQDVRFGMMANSQLVIHDFDTLIKGLELYRQQLSVPIYKKDEPGCGKIEVCFTCAAADDVDMIEKEIAGKVSETLKSMENTTSLEFFLIEGSDK